ncbi:MAG: hypothetical protein EOP61_17780 [Sphingomonadales bacterium]|nr:MAG: hypothetical protein EOP61_17780 [Sphingomonadales bacterium]
MTPIEDSSGEDGSMFKDYLLAPVSLDKHVACQDYIIHRHSQTVLRNPAFDGVFHRYVQYPPLPADQVAPRHSLYNRRSEFALITEHACVDGDLFRKALQDDRHKEQVKKDEEHIVAEFLNGACLCFDMTETEIFSSPRTGRYHVFDFLKRRADVSEGSFFAELEKEGELLARDADFRQVALRRCHNRVNRDDSLYAAEGDTGAVTDQDYDAIIDTWTDSLDRLARFYPDIRTRQAFYVDQQASFSIVATEHILADRGVVVGLAEPLKQAV